MRWSSQGPIRHEVVVAGHDCYACEMTSLGFFPAREPGQEAEEGSHTLLNTSSLCKRCSGTQKAKVPGMVGLWLKRRRRSEEEKKMRVK